MTHKRTDEERSLSFHLAESCLFNNPRVSIVGQRLELTSILTSVTLRMFLAEIPFSPAFRDRIDASRMSLLIISSMLADYGEKGCCEMRRRIGGIGAYSCMNSM
jgi:hypothetical protein